MCLKKKPQHTRTCSKCLYFTADTGTGSDSVVIVFGTPDRSAVIWGITFHPEQFAERHPGGLSIEISYNYYKGGDTHSGFDIFLKISKGSGNTTI